jgi:hypothetical protein
MAYTRATTDATTMKDFNGGNGGLAGDVVLTFPLGAIAVVKGQLVGITSGYIALLAATTTQPVGVAAEAVDNSAGSAGDKYISVIVRGVAQVNAFIAESGTYDDNLVPFTVCGLSTDGTTPGQSVSCGADCTIPIGIMLSTYTMPAATVANVTINALVYVDCLQQPGAI